MADADSTPGKSPAFQFYPNDFLSDANVIVMSLQERGAYITLVCICWQQGGLPAQVERLARLCGTPTATFQRLWPAISPCFRSVADGQRLLHPRLEKERKKQRAYRKAQSDKGKLGGRPKKPELSTEKAEAFENESQLRPAAKAGERSSSSSSDFSQKTNVREFPATKEPTTTEERAGHFTNITYPTLYQKYRKGARYVSKPTFDFMEAVELCRVWDDARLEKIATVFLTTDHQFAENGSRTMAQLRALASWCDSKLVEAGIA